MSDLSVSATGGEEKFVRCVGIGASAGGLDACRGLFAHLPSDTGMAFIVVLHLDPTHESHLRELLARSTEMPVVEVSSEMRVLADHVYVIVPDTDLDLREGMLRPRRREESSGVRRPIDALFGALARSYRERAVAVVLSGTGEDGSEGMREVRKAGGVCLVQEPDSADFSGMPRAAIATGAVDRVLRPAEMGEALAGLVGRERDAVTPQRPDKPDQDRRDQQYRDSDARGPHEDDIEPTSEGFKDILDLVSAHHGVRFDNYRTGTLTRRISRRMRLNHFSDAAGYADFLRDKPTEIEALYQDLLIDVTRFFRDSAVWERLSDDIIPALVEAAGEEEKPLRFWVPACSSGEEAYSLAIVALEALRDAGLNNSVQIFATDVNERSIGLARRGLYPGTISEEVDQDLLDRYFHRQGEHYQVNARVRELVTFAVHDLLVDPPFSRMMLVSCRNLLIYLESDAQRRALELMSYALSPGGYLVLGTSESIGRGRDDLEVVSESLRIYKSKATGPESPRQTPRWMATRHQSAQDSPPMPDRGVRAPNRNVERHLEHHILRHHAPASVVINTDYDILHFYGPTEEFLAAPTGATELDLLAWLRPGLYAELRPALERAIDTDETVDIERMYLERGDQVRPITSHIEPLDSIPGAEGLYLVTFRTLPPETTGGDAIPDEEQSQVRRLEAQLRTARRDQRQLRQRLEDSSEEYQAHNEELLSLNEELQSTNEELETSKEEMQSLNEEMLTVNRELEEKNVELRELNNDLNNLLLSTDIPTIFLDMQMRVRRFTPASTRVMRLVPSDIGRSIEHVKERYHNGNLIDEAAAVAAGEGPFQTEVQADDGRYYTQRILPYRTDEGDIDGVSIIFTDITEQKQRAAEIEEARQYSEAIVRTIRTPLLVLDANLQVLSANECFHETFETSAEVVEGERIFEIDAEQWDIPGLRSLLQKVLPERLEVEDYDIEHNFDRLGRRFLRLNARTMARPHSDPLILLSIEDDTARRFAEMEATQRADELREEHERKDEFLAMLGHELRNPLAALSYGLEYLGEAGERSRDEQTRLMMGRQLTRMQMMLDQLLEMSRIASGKIVIESEPVDLSEIAHHALEVVMPSIEAHDHQISTSLPPPGEVVVIGDANRLAQVIENLLTNAVKYTEDGGEIALIVEADGDDAVVRVRDTGVGIDPELLPHIFGLFTQASQTLQRSEGGLGLGLSLANELVEMHHGKLSAHSEGLGEGSEFVIRLPRAGGTPVRHKEEPVSDGEERPRRVLVVDDEEDATELLSLILESHGHHTRVANDGRSALECARSFDPEVILLDLGLPGMSGYEVARQLREEHGDGARLIALTGYREDAERLEAAGFDRHIVKPPNFDRLIGWITESD